LGRRLGLLLRFALRLGLRGGGFPFLVLALLLGLPVRFLLRLPGFLLAFGLGRGLLLPLLLGLRALRKFLGSWLRRTLSVGGLGLGHGLNGRRRSRSRRRRNRRALDGLGAHHRRLDRQGRLGRL